jgi:hypothetical protein
VLRRKRISTSRGRAWEWLHSMWILWTLTFGFFNWIAFAYIGIRARQPKWLLAAVFYAAPFGLGFIFGSFVSDSWLNAFIAAAVGLSVVSIVHAFLVRKEYLLRLELIQRERANVSVTSFGSNWELRHSLWVAENKGFGADVAALIRARNDFHHGRGPTMEEDVLAASNEAQVRLQRCMEALAFLTKYPIRLVQDFDVERRNDDFVLKCLRLEGDGPGFPQEKISFPKALPRGDLVLDQGDGNWSQLYPFVVAFNFPNCRYRETYFIDRWDDRKGMVTLKSFERGHTEEKEDVASTLASALASLVVAQSLGS